MVVLPLYRPGEATSGGAAAQAGYEPPPEATELVLSELRAASVDALLAAHLGLVPEAVEKLVKERAGGNPFYLEELVRHLLEGGILGMSDAGYELTREIQADDLPPGIESLIAARLDRLSRAALSVAQHASVIGRSFVMPLLLRLKAVAREADCGLTELLAHEVVLETAGEPGGGGSSDAAEYLFKHALTRDVAYGGMLVSYRRRVHLAVARAIEEVFGKNRQDYLAKLGYHWEQAGRVKKARDCYLAGARAAVKRYGHAEAEQAYRAYLRLVTKPTEESIEARNELGEKVLQLRGRSRETEMEHSRALEEARGIGARALEARSMMALGVVHWMTGRMQEAQGLYSGALAVARDQGDHRSEGAWLGVLANLHRTQGRLEAAWKIMRRALRIARELGDRRREGVVLGNLAGMCNELGRKEEARKLLRQALAIHREVGARRSEGMVLGNLGSVYHEQGPMSEARKLYEESLQIAREVGDRRYEAVVLGNLASLCRGQSQIEEARELYEQSLRIVREVDDRRFEGHVVGSLAILHYEQGRMEEARKLLRQALAIHREVGDRRFEGIVLGNLANLLHDQGFAKEARRLYRESLQIHREVADLRFEGVALGNLAILDMHQGRMGQARTLYAQAIQITRRAGNLVGQGILLGNFATLHCAEGQVDVARKLLRQALAVVRKTGDRGSEGCVLGKQAGWGLLFLGDVARSRELAAKGEDLLRVVGGTLELGKLLCIRGHIEIAGEHGAAECLREVESIASKLAVRTGSELGKELAKLRRAQAAFDAGKFLVCGYVREDLTEGQRRWLGKHRPEALQAGSSGANSLAPP